MSSAPYRLPPKNAPDPYLAAWAAVRRQLRWFWVGLLLIVASFAVLTLLTTDARVLGLIGAPLGVSLAIYAGRARCPRCGKYFSRRGSFHNERTRKCLNCGIALGTPKSATDAPQMTE